MRPLPVQSPLFIQAAEQRPPDPIPHAFALPPSQSGVTGRGSAIAAREVGPAGSRAEHPEDAIDGASIIHPRSAAALTWWEQWRENRPLLIGQVSRCGVAIGTSPPRPTMPYRRAELLDGY